MNEEEIRKRVAAAYPYLDAEALRQMAGMGHFVSVQKGDRFLRPGKTDQRVGLVIRGLFRGIVRENDEEQTLWFSSETDLIASYISILADEPSNMSYEALEDAELFVLDYAEIRRRSKTDPVLADSLLSLMERLLLESYRRLEKFIFYRPEDRYLRILEDQPSILNRVSQKMLASYIGITPVSLSRLRARMQDRYT